jgi:hypothetical protein
MKSIGEVRETSADALLRLPGLGSGSVAHLREASDCHRPMACDQSPKNHDPVPPNCGRTSTTVRFNLAKWAISCEGGEAKLSYLKLDCDFAVDELAVVYPILNAIFDPIPIVAEETDSFVRGRIG